MPLLETTVSHNPTFAFWLVLAGVVGLTSLVVTNLVVIGNKLLWPLRKLKARRELQLFNRGLPTVEDKNKDQYIATLENRLAQARAAQSAAHDDKNAADQEKPFLERPVLVYPGNNVSPGTRN